MTDISEDDIRKRAYALWEADGRPEGSHEAHWLQASHELTRQTEADASPQTAAPFEAVNAEAAPRKHSKIV